MNNKNSYAKILEFTILELKIADMKTALLERQKFKDKLVILRVQGISELIDNDYRFKNLL